MSRFYDALRQASRFQQAVTGGAEEKPWEPFGVDVGNVVPSTPTGGDVGEVVETASALSGSGTAPAARRDPWTIISEHEGPRIKRPHNANLGTSAVIDIERQARVMPNIADPVVVEHYRRLRTKLMQQHAVKSFRTLLVTSANPQEGKTVTTLNLALSFAMLSEFRVLVIDGDLRRGTLGKWLRVGERAGLSNLIEGSATLNDVILRCEQIPVHFIVRGNSTVQPAELLHAPQLGEQFQRISEQFDLVLVDSPPVNLITDTQLLASHCEAVLVVARAFTTTCKALERAVQDLAGFRLLGAVLNGGAPVGSYGRYGGYY
jgi:capsular exopolysaccharide synthesis family protein